MEMSAQMISEQLPAHRGLMDIVARRFNETFLYRWQKIIDFLKLHYLLSQRNDSAFWRDNRDPATISPRLLDQLALWRYRAPANTDFSSNNEVFPAASYQYVLYGMGFVTDDSHQAYLRDNWPFASQQFAQNERMIKEALALLPDHRALIDSICQYGLAKV